MADPAGEVPRPELPGEPKRRVAVFGGSFNPPHVAHVLAAIYALSTDAVDEVLVVPVYRHPFAKELASFEDRLEMCRLAVGWLPRVGVSTLERELGGDSFTLRTVEHLAMRHPSYAMRLLVGADVLADLPKWHRFDRIAELAPPLVLGRGGVALSPRVTPGYGIPATLPPVMLPQISSTEVRTVIAAGDVDAVRPFVPHAVVEYIVKHGLYRSGNGERSDRAPETEHG